MTSDVAGATLSEVALGREKGDTQGDQIISILFAARRPLLPCEIAQKIKLPKNHTRAVLSKLKQKNLVMKEGEGYTLPPLKAESILESKIGIIDHEKRLPKLHDIHLLFKIGNVCKCLSQQKNLNELFYEDNDSGKTATGRKKADGKVLNHGNQNKASLSATVASKSFNDFPTPRIIDRLTNPLDDGFIAKGWPRARTRDIKGGSQEKFKIFENCTVTIQIRHNGTIQIASGNSKHPFDCAEFISFLNVLDGIFICRADISFRKIAPFFYIDSVHINTDDDPAGLELSGASKLNLTTNQFEEGLIRVYEKVLGGVPKIRTEFQLNGNFEQHNLGNLSPILATIFGEIDSTTSIATALVANKSAQSATEDVRGLARETRATNKMLQDFIRISNERDRRREKHLKSLEAKVGQ